VRYCTYVIANIIGGARTTAPARDTANAIGSLMSSAANANVNVNAAAHLPGSAG
jgi:hypothetical protein